MCDTLIILATSFSVWKEVCIDVTPTNDVIFVVFEGRHGGSFSGDIGLDDVHLEKGRCDGSNSNTGPSGLYINIIKT